MRFFLCFFFTLSISAQTDSAKEYAVIKGTSTVSIKTAGSGKKKKNTTLKYSYVLNPLEINKELHSEDILKKAFESYLKNKHKDSKVEVNSIKLFKTMEEAKSHASSLLKDRAKRTYMTSTFLSRYMRENAKEKPVNKKK